MSKQFGEQFKIAREATGKTLGDFAKITKIRTIYLQQIENGEFDGELPDVYLRGFMQSYAKHLRMDVEKVMAECPIKSTTVMESNERRKEMVQKIAKQEMILESSSKDEVQPQEQSHGSLDFSSETFQSYLKLGGIIGGGIIVLLIIILLLTKIFSSSGKDEYVNTKTQPSSVAVNKSVNPVSRNISITATEPVKIILRNKTTKEKLFSGTLAAGETKNFNFTEPMQLFYDKGEALLIKQSNGKLMYPQAGRGGLEL